MTVLQTFVTEKQPPLTLTHLWCQSDKHVAKRPITPLTLCYLVKLKDDQVTTLYTWWTTPLVIVVRNSHVHAWSRLCMLTVPKSEAEVFNFKNFCGTGLGQWATDS